MPSTRFKENFRASKLTRSPQRSQRKGVWSADHADLRRFKKKAGTRKHRKESTESNKIMCCEFCHSETHTKSTEVTTEGGLVRENETGFSHEAHGVPREEHEFG